jgi:hypothetical protein
MADAKEGELLPHTHSISAVLCQSSPKDHALVMSDLVDWRLHQS